MVGVAVGDGEDVVAPGNIVENEEELVVAGNCNFGQFEAVCLLVPRNVNYCS